MVVWVADFLMKCVFVGIGLYEQVVEVCSHGLRETLKRESHAKLLIPLRLVRRCLVVLPSATPTRWAFIATSLKGRPQRFRCALRELPVSIAVRAHRRSSNPDFV